MGPGNRHCKQHKFSSHAARGLRVGLSTLGPRSLPRVSVPLSLSLSLSFYLRVQLDTALGLLRGDHSPPPSVPLIPAGHRGRACKSIILNKSRNDPIRLEVYPASIGSPFEADKIFFAYRDVKKARTENCPVAFAS